MQGSHGNSGNPFPTRSARRVLAATIAALGALWPAVTQGDEPAETRNLSAVADQAAPLATQALACRRLPPVEPASPTVSLANYLPSDAESPLAGLHEGQAVNYLAVPGEASNSPLTAITAAPGQPLFKFSGMQQPVPPPGEGEQPAEAQAAESDEQTYGQAPTNNALQFLRDVDVLLAPGNWQADTGFAYTYFEDDFPFAIPPDVAEGLVRQRILYTPLAVRYGLSTNIQLFASLPVGFSNTQISATGENESIHVNGLGDLTFGASIHLFKGEGQLPDIIGTVGATAPTGKFNAPIFGFVPGSNLGQGFWAYNLQLLAINRYDPVIVFYGGGYRHLFERPFDGVEVQPGEQANYMLGVGFSVNDRVTLSTTFQGFYMTNTYVEGEEVRGSNLEPMSIRFAATMVRNCRIIEPFVQVGMTAAAPRANVGVVITFY